ncbi:protein of unknown function [Beijerinckiaceae bacterium RH AL1]|jgi:hypothetical protein|nr:hypothetical protein [Beijerinckiaceae bacterium]VVB47519.1 protein of unknown function [Beijerinckiaceae bacterium RH CH11]VVB47600.1 protein of unknown function [Beijerinckiaceae bacterium RH AL8]VVC55929.1 protein of unknown function [Beijerinckiaceae bacterium RH AL1]
MTRYFFNVFASSDAYDDEGFVLQDDQGAHLHMMDIATKLIKESKQKTWTIEVLNNKGILVGCLEFGMLRDLSATALRAQS